MTTEQLKPNGDGIGRIVKATRCSYQGFCAAYKHESAFRQELLLCAILLPFSFILASSSGHWVALVCSLLFLLFAEVVNSAIEALADQISTDIHKLIGRAKDLGSLAVFIALIVIVITWGEALLSALGWIS
jgi:diacylglycerol kinase (ATP)